MLGKAKDLHDEALALLEGGLKDLLEHELGHVEVAGSVALDLMAVPDIDLYVRLEAKEAYKMLSVFPKLARQLANQGYDLAKIIFNDEHVIPDPKFPTSPGLYSGVTFSARGSKRVWKLDLWGWDQRFYEVRHKHHHDLLASLQNVDRGLILSLKTREGYGSVFSSMDVYTFACRKQDGLEEDFEQFLTSL